MLALPIFGWFLYVIVSGMVFEYKYAKFRDKVDKTDYQARKQIYFMVFILWCLIGYICVITASLMAESNCKP